MIRYAYHKARSGPIHSIVTMHAGMEEGHPDFLTPCGEGVLDTTHCVVDGIITERKPPFRGYLTLNMQFTLRGVPEGAVVTVMGNDFVCDGTDLVIEFDEPGDYIIWISPPFEYTEERLEVTIG